jgi:hypothetical protein
VLPPSGHWLAQSQDLQQCESSGREIDDGLAQCYVLTEDGDRQHISVHAAREAYRDTEGRGHFAKAVIALN